MVKLIVATVPPPEPVVQKPLMPEGPAVIDHPLGEPAVTLSIVKLLPLIVNSNAPIFVPEIETLAVPWSPLSRLAGALMAAEPGLTTPNAPRGASSVTSAIEVKAMNNFFKMPIIFSLRLSVDAF
jgi:hypothetical protein